ncbi:MAG: hypothetical protein IJI57_15490 [Flexilinea sp.]|nr:hypothetical protein [Flexilinea sp.]
MYGQLQEGPSQSDAQGDSSPVPASRQQENRPQVLSHREQLSKTGPHGKVVDALEKEEGSTENKKSEIGNKKSDGSVNEDVRMKNEEEWPVVGDQWSEAQRDVSAAVAEPTQQGCTIVAPGNNPVSACSDSQLPPFVEILQRVMERSKDSEDGSLTFTFEEMEFLAKDPLFAHFDPALAADIRKVLAEKPPDP